MEATWKLLTSPEWWLQAVVISIIVSIVGAYAKDGFSAGLSIVSVRYKARSARRAEESRQRIALMLMEPTLLTVAHERVTLLFIKYVALIIVALGFPVHSAIVAHFPDADPLRAFFSGPRIPYVPLVVTVVSFLWSLVLQNRWMDLQRECEIARARVEKETAKRVAAHAGSVSAQTNSDTKTSGVTRA